VFHISSILYCIFIPCISVTNLALWLQDLNKLTYLLTYLLTCVQPPPPLWRFSAIPATDLYKYYPDAVPPIQAVSYHVAKDKPSVQDGDKFQSIFSDNLQPIATRGKKAHGTLMIDQHCGNGCSIKRAPLSVSCYNNEISGGHIGRGVVRRRCYAGPVLPLWAPDVNVMTYLLN